MEEVIGSTPIFSTFVWSSSADVAGGGVREVGGSSPDSNRIYSTSGARLFQCGRFGKAPYRLDTQWVNRPDFVLIRTLHPHAFNEGILVLHPAIAKSDS